MSASEHSLLPQHVAYLTARAVPSALAIEAGLISVDGSTAAHLLNRTRALSCGGLAIPYPAHDKGYCRVRLDEPHDGAKFLAPAGREVPIYCPPVRSVGTDEPLVVVEGPIKALALVAHGLNAVGLGGTGTTLATKAAHRRLNSSWDQIPLDGRKVVIVFDAGRRMNPNVARDEARLAMALEHAGAVVSVTDLPPAPGGKDWGPDDFLGARGIEELRKVIDSASPADPAGRAETLVNAGRGEHVAALLDDLPFCIAVEERGPGAERRAFETLRRAGVRVRDWEASLRRARQALSSAAKTSNRARAGLGGTVYVIIDDHLCVLHERGELPLVEPLTNFTAQIQREVVLDDGAEERRRFCLSGRLSGGKALPEITVDAAEFASGHWLITKWGARANLSAQPGAAAHMRAAIQELSQPTREHVFAHTGVREVDGRRVFLHAGGAIGGEGVQTLLEGRIGQYRLPAHAKDRREALETSLRFLDVAPHTVTVPLLAACYRAPTSSILPVDCTVWVVGRTGSTKSTLVALLLGHDGDFDRTRLTANWNDTAASIEDTLFRAKDVVAVIDDFAPKGSESWDALRGKAETVLRSIGNRSSRGRMRADLTAHASRPPRGLVISTGEDLPTGESIHARLVIVRVIRDSIDLELLSELEGQRERLAHAKAAFIEWLLANYDSLAPWLQERFRARRSELRGAGGHMRTPEALAHLALGIELLAAFAVSLRVFDSVRAGRFVREAVDALRELGAVAEQEIACADPVQRFLEVLRSLRTQNRIELLCDPNIPLGNGPGVEQLGWLDVEKRLAYLLPNPTYRVVIEELRRSGESMPISAPTLWQRMTESGLLVPGDSEHHTRKVSVGGGRSRVLSVHLWVLDESQSDRDVGSGVGASILAPEIARGDHRQGCGSAAAPPARNLDLGPSLASAEGITSEAAREPDAAVGTTVGMCVDASASTARGVGVASSGVSHTHDWLPPFVGRSSRPAPRAHAEARWVPDPHLVAHLRLIDRDEALAAAAEELRGADAIALDLRAEGSNPLVDRPRLLALKALGEPVIVDLQRIGDLGPLGEVLRGALVVGHDLRAPLAFLAHCYDIAPSAVWDTALAARLHDSGFHAEEGERRFSFADLVPRELGEAVAGAAPPEDLSTEPARAAHDVGLLLPLRERLAAKINEAGLAKALALEFDVLPVVVAMALAGVVVARSRWEALVESRRAQATALSAEVKAKLGVENPRSPDELLHALHSAGAQVDHTNKVALARYRDVPGVKQLIDFRRCDAFVTGPGRGVIDALARSPDGRVRARVDQLAAPTGRFGCSAPNLLGLEKSHEVRDCIVPSEGCVFVVADYAAIELRVLAHVTRDEHLTRVFQERGDPHALMASAITGKPVGDVTKAERQRAKAVNFGFAFGMGVDTFVERALADYGVTVSPSDAQRFKKVYGDTYPAVAAWQERIRKAMPVEVRSASGRRRLFVDHQEGYCERLNLPVQGTAADGIKLAMVLLHKRLRPPRARLVLCVHDELVVEAQREHAVAVRDLVEATMVEGMAHYVTTVPIAVEADIRATWSASSSVVEGSAP